MAEVAIPTFKAMMNPILEALHHLGGSGTNDEINAEAARTLNLTDEQLAVLVRPDRNDTLVSIRASWARTYLKKVGLLENPRRRTWALTEAGKNTRWVDPDDVQRTVLQMKQSKKDMLFSIEATSIVDGDEDTIMTEVAIPKQKEFYNPTLQALRNLDGSGTNREIYDEVVKIMNLTDEQLEILHNPDKSSKTKVEYRMTWAQTHLKMYGLIEDVRRGVWALTAKGQNTKWVDPDDVSRTVARMSKEKREQKKEAQKQSHLFSQPEAVDNSLPDIEDTDDDSKWREELYAVLHQMRPAAFERLFQRILRQDGFYQVEVTGRSGDGGIDGIGVIRVGGFLSFRVLFQCKRYKDSLGAGVVRDFRGAMVGRTDKGLIVTTGHFTPAAKREATRDGAPEIDLIDGEQLIDKLKELSLGVKTEKVVVERVMIDRDWFQNI